MVLAGRGQAEGKASSAYTACGHRYRIAAGEEPDRGRSEGSGSQAGR